MRLSHGIPLCLACMMLVPSRYAMATSALIAQAPSATRSLSAFSNVLSLENALEIAERESAQLKALRSHKSWGMGRQEAADQHPNPEFSFMVEDIALDVKEGESNPGLLKAEISQPIELGGKRDARVQLALVENQAKTSEAVRVWLKLRSEVALAFVQVVKLQEAKKLSLDRAEVAKRLQEAAVERVKAGKVAPVEESRLSANFTFAELELNETDQELKAAQLKLSTLMGVHTSKIGEISYPFLETKILPNLDSLQAKLIRSVHYKIADGDVEKAKAELRLEDSKKVPDLTLKFATAYQTYAERFQFGAGFSVPLPLFDRNQGGVTMAMAQVESASALADKEQQNLSLELAESYNDLSLSYQKIKVLKSNIMPRLQETVSAIEMAYREGRIGYLDVVESQESLFSLREKFLEALARYHSAFIRIEYLTSQPDKMTFRLQSDGIDGVTK